MLSWKLSDYIKNLARAMKWSKWPFLALMILVAIIVISVKPTSDSRIGVLFGYYFQVIFAFTLLSSGIGTFYSSLVLEHMAPDYSDECARILRIHSPVHTWRFLKFAMTTGDETLHRWAKMGIFWLCCVCSILVTAPIGAIVFFILIS